MDIYCIVGVERVLEVPGVEVEMVHRRQRTQTVKCHMEPTESNTNKTDGYQRATYLIPWQTCSIEHHLAFSPMH